MKFLASWGGEIDNNFAGVFTSPYHYGIPKGIKDGLPWAGDNGAFKNGFDEKRFIDWLKLMEPYSESCLFITMPDVLGDAKATLLQWQTYQDIIELKPFPLALVAQDGLKIDWKNSTFYVGADADFTDWIGIEHPEIGVDDDPEYWDAMQEYRVEVFAEDVSTLFIGGTTTWKMSQDTIECIKFAQSQNMHVHIGRINYWKRYKHFARLEGSHEFTCDGTRQRYERDKAIAAWKKYMDINKRQIRLDLSDSNNSG